MEIKTPSLGVNDNSATIVKWLYKDSDNVHKGDVVAVIETTKSAFDINAPIDGFLAILCLSEEKIGVGQIVGLVVNDLDQFDEIKSSFIVDSMDKNTEEFNATKKAIELSKKYGVDLKILSSTVSGIIRERDVENYKPQPKQQTSYNNHNPISVGYNGRVLIVGGGKGATQLLSIMLNEKGTEVVGILDDIKEKHNTTINGIPILDYTYNLRKIVDEYNIESIICAVSTSISFRKKIYEDVKLMGLKLANAIHNTVVFDSDVNIGEGNFIGANCYIGNSTSIGSYCFISSGSIIEHHNTWGNGITTGPNVTTSGSVTVGDHVCFGTGIFIEPRLNIGSQSIISSGSCVVDHIPEKGVLRKNYNQEIK